LTLVGEKPDLALPQMAEPTILARKAAPRDGLFRSLGTRRA
jgi:hypothetical protein